MNDIRNIKLEISRPWNNSVLDATYFILTTFEKVLRNMNTSVIKKTLIIAISGLIIYALLAIPEDRSTLTNMGMLIKSKAAGQQQFNRQYAHKLKSIRSKYSNQ